MPDSLIGRIVQTPDADRPYKLVIEDDRGNVSEFPVPSISEGERLMREKGAIVLGRPPMDWHI